MRKDPMQKQIVALMALVALAQAGPAWAYRPFDSTDADVAAPGEVELELGPLQYASGGGGRSLILPGLELTLGITPGWEIGLEGQHRLGLAAGATPASQSLEGPELFCKTML